MVTALYAAVFGVWMFVVYQHMEIRRLEYLTHRCVKRKIELQKKQQHLEAQVLKAERLECIEQRLQRAGVTLAPHQQPVIHVELDAAQS